MKKQLQTLKEKYLLLKKQNGIFILVLIAMIVAVLVLIFVAVKGYKRKTS